MNLESPKHLGKQTGSSRHGGKGHSMSFAPLKPVKGRNIVVVSQKTVPDGEEEDNEITALQVAE